MRMVEIWGSLTMIKQFFEGSKILASQMKCDLTPSCKLDSLVDINQFMIFFNIK